MHSQQYASRATNLREFPFRVLYCSGDLGGNFVLELCVLEQHMADLGGVCVWNKEAAKKKSRNKNVLIWESKALSSNAAGLDCILPVLPPFGVA